MLSRTVKQVKRASTYEKIALGASAKALPLLAAEDLSGLTGERRPDPCRGQFTQANYDGFRSKTLAMKSRKIQRAPGHAARASFGSS